MVVIITLLLQIYTSILKGLRVSSQYRIYVLFSYGVMYILLIMLIIGNNLQYLK